MIKAEFDTTELDRFAENLGNLAIFSPHMVSLTRAISAFLLRIITVNTPIGTTFRLQAGWMKENEIVITREKTGYQVVLVNRCEYAKYVNDGHYSYNQFNVGGEPYIVKHRTVPLHKKWSAGFPNDAHYVFGRFFVEDSLIQVQYSEKLSELIMTELERWWMEC